jgi:hypothetical protein
MIDMEFAYVNENEKSLVPHARTEAMKIIGNTVHISFANERVRIKDYFESDEYSKLHIADIYKNIIEMINDKNDKTNGYLTIIYPHDIKKVLDDMVADINK